MSILHFYMDFLEEEVFIKKSSRYDIDGKEDKVYRLKKSLYVLKQKPKVWYKKTDEYLKKNGFSRIPSDPTL